MHPAILVLFALAVVAIAVALSRANELFCLKLRRGKLRLVRGRVPQGLLNDIADVVRDAGVAACTIRGVSEGGRAAIEARGLGEGHQQRLRNVIGRWPLVRIRNAPPSR